ncbi:NADH-quinone oxidoreductase subunit J [Coxiella endosymbiont of Dermacentor marginatus]|uniref:NADH-quinone oxidoreductase subunit J n=1 Tax=Coxiella endosymbiont of Dermacentor marginatus TaxID=1656159 RepID=UPI0022235DE1|nr:NADH-quinone oxidoreductase subunit J [Coxiella endosymbiont of Dermacentor marginatus]
MLPIYEIIFFIFSAILITATVMVIISRNSVYAAFFLVLTFFASAILWMMMQAEFLALVLIFIYVSAIMTLFLFVVMMLDINLSKTREKFVKFLPFSVTAVLLLIATMIITVNLHHFGISIISLPQVPDNNSNIKAIGSLLYTDYLYPFEIAAVILLVAIIAVITLAFHGRRSDAKVQRVPEQLKVEKLDRLRVVKIKMEKQ